MWEVNLIEDADLLAKTRLPFTFSSQLTWSLRPSLWIDQCCLQSALPTPLSWTDPTKVQILVPWFSEDVWRDCNGYNSRSTTVLSSLTAVSWPLNGTRRKARVSDVTERGDVQQWAPPMSSWETFQPSCSCSHAPLLSCVPDFLRFWNGWISSQQKARWGSVYTHPHLELNEATLKVASRKGQPTIKSKLCATNDQTLLAWKVKLPWNLNNATKMSDKTYQTQYDQGVLRHSEYHVVKKHPPNQWKSPRKAWKMIFAHLNSPKTSLDMSPLHKS